MPDTTLSDPSRILDALGKRSFDGSYGIARASDYLKAFAGCLGDGFCPRSAAGIAPEEWVGLMKDAEQKLVYCEKGMNVKNTFTASSPDYLLEFECVVTTTRKDRDGDVLKSDGAVLDSAAPLLWQHNSLLPLGRVLRRTGQSQSKLTARCAIANFQGDGELASLARDAATLVKCGALRISHGFEPHDFQDLGDKDGRYLISSFEILEVSLVSIPSNVDAVIQAFGEKQLRSTFTKNWAEHLIKSRPVQGRGVTFDKACECGGQCVGECHTKSAAQPSVSNESSSTPKDSVPMSTETKPVETKDNSVPSSPPRTWQDGERAIPQAIQQGDSEWPNRHPPAVVWDYPVAGVDAFDVLAPTANDLTWSIATGGIPGPQRNPAPPDASLIAPGLSQEVATPTPTDGSSMPKPSDPGFAPGPQRSSDPKFLKAVEDSISLNLRKIRATLLMAFKAGVSESAAKEIGKLFDMAGMALKQIAGQSPPVGLPSPMQYPVGSGSMVDNPAGSSMMPVPSNNATNAGNINYFLSIVGPNGNNPENVNAFYSIPVANNLNVVSMTGTGGMLPNTIQSNPPTGSTSQTQGNSNNGAIYSYPGGTGSGSSSATSYPNTGGVGSAAAALPNTMQSNPPTGGKTAKDWNGVAVDYPPVGDPIGDGDGPPLTNTGRIDPGMKENVADPNISGSLYSPPVDVTNVGAPPIVRLPGAYEASFSGVTEKEVADWLNDSNENTVKAGIAESEDFEAWLSGELVAEL